MIPSFWSQFVSTNQLIDECVKIPEESDLSGIGCSLQVMTESSSIKESQDYYPGVAVKKHGFIPVARCLIGSGDPYFININDGEFGKLYRIYHDASMIDDDNYDLEDAVEIVLEDYRGILKYVKK